MKCQNCNNSSDNKYKFCPYCGEKFGEVKVVYRIEEQGGRAVKTSEFRPPKKGELFLSGAKPLVYVAPNDLSIPYRIMERLVED